MANSRSNIYPVQLQGAELCLNKYDAEIKQYSGFNKNNSPFVGGCLSNVFTKEQQIEGGNADNVYIDANGDVYKVTTEGLWKNDKKVLDVDPTKLYDIEEIGLKGYNIVSIFDEKCFVYCDVDSLDAETPFHFILRFYDPNIEDYREEIIFKWNNYSDTAVDCKRVQCGENLYTWTCLVNYRYERLVSSSYQTRHTYYPVVFASSIIDGEVDFVKYDTFSGLLDISYDDGYKRKVLSLVHGLYNEQHETLYLLLSSCLAGASSAPLFTLYSVSFNTSSGLELTVTKVIDLMNTTFSSRSYPFASYFDKTELTGRIIEGNLNSALTKDSQCRYFLSQNKIWLQSFQSSETPAVSNCYYKILADEDTGIKIKFYDEYDIVHYGPGLGNSPKDTVGFNFGTMTKVYTASNSYVKGYCDYETIGLGYDEEGKLRFTTGCVMSKMVLLNNEEVTGITLPDTQRILVTDWNSIDENKVFVPNIESGYTYCCDSQLMCLYKSGGKYYKLKKVNYVFLTVVNNQIVLNCDMFYNAFRITDEKPLLYAPSWNNRLLVRNCVVRDTDIKKNKYYFASSINEYNLQDNASLLLNPVPIVNEPDSSDFAIGLSEIDYKISYLVNVYGGATVADCKYIGSVLNTFNKMLKVLALEDLPFPIDTNGNVIYSPSIFSEITSSFGNNLLIKNGNSYYPLVIGNDNTPVMSFYLASGIEGLQNAFIIQGQYYGIINNQIYSLSFNNGVINSIMFIVNVQGLQFCGNTPYEALFFSKTNRCLYSFTGANVLNAKQFVDKISEIRNYKYNPATQSIFLITDIGVIVYSLFGIYQIEFLNCQDMYLLNNGVVLTDNEGTFKYVKYYKEETTEDYTKENITLETCFYGMNNQTVTINDCLYFRIFSEEHEEGDLKVSATTISLEGRKTEETTFKIKASDWDAITHTIYLRYQPKEQRGLGVAFSIDSPFKIASLSVGSQADAILVDKVSKGAINAPQITSNNAEW